MLFNLYQLHGRNIYFIAYLDYNYTATGSKYYLPCKLGQQATKRLDPHSTSSYRNAC